MAYTNIIVALDLSNDANHVLEKALQVCDTANGRLHLIHVIEPMVDPTGYDLNPALPLEWENLLQQRAEDFLGKISKEYENSNISINIRIGSVKAEIFSLVDEVTADLIVVGTHGRHGVELLFGSTATSVIHGTPCDVLSVKVAGKV